MSDMHIAQSHRSRPMRSMQHAKIVERARSSDHRRRSMVVRFLWRRTEGVELLELLAVRLGAKVGVSLAGR